MIKLKDLLKEVSFLDNFKKVNPGYNPKSIIVMPETMKVFPSFIMELEDMKAYNCYGICSDYVSKMK
jgi:hypothetical protein